MTQILTCRHQRQKWLASGNKSQLVWMFQMKKLLCILLVAFMAVASLTGCNREKEEDSAMKFSFESLDFSEQIGGSYFMDFGEMESQEDAAIAEGKLLSAFGQPEYTSENYENSFNYIIRATADNGESVILTVYGMGVVHIGAEQQNDFAQKAASALIEYVNAFAPADYSRTVYYLDFDMQIDIQVKGGKATISQSQISQEKANELFDKFYK